MSSITEMYRLIASGGWVMIPIAFCSFYSWMLIIERFFAFQKAKVLPPHLMPQIHTLIREKKVADLQALSRSNESSITRVLRAGLAVLHLDRQVVAEEFERSGKKEILLLEKHLTMLGSIAAVGPLLGLFGTVTGMITTFGVIRTVGVGNPLELSGGISEALICTAGGMVVGVPALILQRYFLRRVDEYSSDMEDTCQDAIQYLKDGR